MTNNIKKDIITVFGTRIISQIIGFIISIVNARMLGPKGKGVYAIFIADIDFLVLFLGLSINTGIVYFISKNHILRSKVIGIAILHFLIGLLLGAILVITSVQFTTISKFIFPENYDTSFYLFFLIFSFALTFVNSILASYFNGLKKFEITNKATLLISVLAIILYPLIFFLSRKGIIYQNLKYVLIVYTFILLVAFLFYLINFLKRKEKIDFKISFTKEYKLFFKFVIIGHLSSLLNFLNYRFDIWVINNNCNISDLGFYSLATNIGALMSVFSVSMMTVLLPNFTDSSQDQKEHYLSLYAKVNFYLLFIISFIALTLSSFVIPFVYGNDFKPSVKIFLVLLPGIFFYASTTIFTSYLISLKKLIYVLLAALLGFVITIILDLVFIPKYGIIAAAIITTVVNTVIFIATFLFSLKFYNGRVKKMFLISSYEFEVIKNTMKKYLY